MLLNLNLKNSQNIGDSVCAPAQYLPLGLHLDLSDNVELNPDDVVIFGGGCIAVRAGLYETKARKILWGAGYSVRGAGLTEGLHVNKGFELYGSRDIGCGDWVACPSCLSPLFDNIPEPTQDIVYYGHAELDPIGDVNNDCMDFEKVLRYLSKGETIITSSYHGMYWGYLMGRNVIVKPFGSKFYTLPWGISTDMGIRYSGALSEARESNLNFYEKVKKIL